MSLSSFNIISRVGVNDIKFGTSRQEVREKLGQPRKSFRRTSEGNLTDVYADHNAFFYYDDNDLLEAVEFADDIELRVNGHLVSNLPLDDLKALILKWDPAAVPDIDGIRSDALGITTGQGDKHDGRYESVLAYRDGYWDDYDAEVQSAI